jgi:hypothetical protein
LEVPFPITNPVFNHLLVDESFSMSNPLLFNSETVVQFNVTSLPFTVDVKEASSTGKAPQSKIAFIIPVPGLAKITFEHWLLICLKIFPFGTCIFAVAVIIPAPVPITSTEGEMPFSLVLTELVLKEPCVIESKILLTATSVLSSLIVFI